MSSDLLDPIDQGELWRLPATKVSALVRARRVRVVEVARSTLERLEAVNPAINAVVEYRPDEVLARARQLDEMLDAGGDPGPLAGVPVTIKCNVDQVGFATTNGVKAQQNLIARENSPVVDNLLRAGALPVGRTNTPAYSYRWFTSNALHGVTRNPHDAKLTPGGSSGGAAAGVAAGIGAIGHGTDIAGSIRYPAYACGLHGLRPSLGRVAAYNPTAAVDRTIGGQLTAVSGPIARTIGDLRLALAAMSAADARDPWWMPAPLTGPEVPRQVALCLRPDGMDTCPEVVAALEDAAGRLRDAGWVVEQVEQVPPLREAFDIQVALWMGDGYDDQVRAAAAEGDRGAITALAGQASLVRNLDVTRLSRALAQRATITRKWQLFLQRHPLLLIPSSAELPFANDLDLQGDEGYARVWRAQLAMVALPLTGLPALSVATGSAGGTPVGVQLVAGRFREDLLLAAGEAIEARGKPVEPIDPR